MYHGTFQVIVLSTLKWENVFVTEKSTVSEKIQNPPYRSISVHIAVSLKNPVSEWFVNTYPVNT